MSHHKMSRDQLVPKTMYDQVFNEWEALKTERKVQEARLQSDEVIFKQQEGIIERLKFDLEYAKTQIEHFRIKYENQLLEAEQLRKDNALVVAVIRENTKIKELLLKTEKLFIRGGRSEYFFLKYKEEAGL